MSATQAPAPDVVNASLVQAGEYMFDLPASWRDDMLVPVRIYADDVLLQDILTDNSLAQLVNVATLPGIVDFASGMPDMHEGYGFPVGGVAATLMPDGVVSPGGVGFDINCGVRLLATALTREQLGDRNTDLTHDIARSIPVGTGRGGKWRLSDAELDAVLQSGAAYLVRHFGFGTENDLLYTESGGALAAANPACVSSRAKERGRAQLGSLGAGNHFVEIQYVEEIFDEHIASAYGIRRNQITILIHTGSRGLGHQVCTDYVRMFDAQLDRRGIVLPDRQLSCAPASSDEGRQYIGAMSAAANYAWANRQLITYRVREVISRMYPMIPHDHVRLVYDVAHNMAKQEMHGGRSLCVHRKGATRAFGPGHPELPEHYQSVGQPVFVPGSMGTASFVMAGTSTSESHAFSSACHGAGRRMSRGEAKRQVTGAEVRKEIEAMGIAVRCPSNKGLAEEAPLAYKDVERVAAVVERAGLARRVARLIPVGVVKG